VEEGTKAVDPSKIDDIKKNIIEKNV